MICGDRPIIQQTAIEYGVCMLVVTGGFDVAAELVETAKAKGSRHPQVQAGYGYGFQTHTMF